MSDTVDISLSCEETRSHEWLQHAKLPFSVAQPKCVCVCACTVYVVCVCVYNVYTLFPVHQLSSIPDLEGVQATQQYQPPDAVASAGTAPAASSQQGPPPSSSAQPTSSEAPAPPPSGDNQPIPPPQAEQGESYCMICPIITL